MINYRVGLFLGFILLTIFAYPQNEQGKGTNSGYPPPGRLFNIGSRKLHMICSGKGSPTIVLIAGGGAFSIDWTLVQNRLDSTTRICSCDRAGLGWSDPGPGEETVEQTIRDLHDLLHVSGEKGLFLLVGASIVGIYIRAYQHAYPSETAGLIFSNSSNRIGFGGKTKSGLIWDLSEDDIRSAFPFPPSTEKRVKETKLGEPFDRLPAKQQAMRLWLNERLMTKWDTAISGPESLLSWRKEFIREFEETDAGKKPPLDKLPVIVISSGPMAYDSVRQKRDGAAGRLDFLSSNSLHITAMGSGHEIHLYQPDTVVKALRVAVRAVRNSIPLPVAEK